MSEAKIFTGSVALVCATSLFLRLGEVNLPEAFLYSVLAVLIVAYWAFQAYLRLAEKKYTRDPDLEGSLSEIRKSNEELTKTVEGHQAKINALILRQGLS